MLKLFKKFNNFGTVSIIYPRQGLQPWLAFFERQFNLPLRFLFPIVSSYFLPRMKKYYLRGWLKLYRITKPPKAAIKANPARNNDTTSRHQRRISVMPNTNKNIATKD